MTPFQWVIVLTVIFIINFFGFAYLYYNVDDPVIVTYTDGLYLSSQVVTSIGMSEIQGNSTIRTLIIIQSVISFVTNILLVIFVSIVISKYMKSNGKSL